MGARMTVRNWVLLGLLSILWGGAFLFVDIALEGLPPLSIVFGRVSLACLTLAVLMRLMGQPFPKGAAQWRALGVMGLLNNAIPFSLFVFAQGHISGSVAAILNATTPLFTVVVAHFALRDEQMTAGKLVGLALGFAGVVVMVGGVQSSAVGWSMLACLAAALSYGFAGVWGRRFRALGVAPMTTAFGQLASSTMIIAPLWVMVDRPWAEAIPSLRVISAVVAIAVFSSALAYLIFFKLLAEAGAVNVSLVTFVIPVSAAVLGWLVLGHGLEARHFAGFGLIALGLIAIDGRVMRWGKR